MSSLINEYGASVIELFVRRNALRLLTPYGVEFLLRVTAL